MKLTTILTCGYLIFGGICASVYAFLGVSPLFYLCFQSATAYRAALSLFGVCALWLIFWLTAFRPLKYLS